MVVKQFLRDTVNLVLWAIGLQGVAFIYDMFDDRLTSPVWDPAYNWGPFLALVLAASALLSMTRLVLMWLGQRYIEHRADVARGVVSRSKLRAG